LSVDKWCPHIHINVSGDRSQQLTLTYELKHINKTINWALGEVHVPPTKAKF